MHSTSHDKQSLSLILGVQGFDKYGVWAQDAVPTPNLQKELKLKVSERHLLLLAGLMSPKDVAHIGSVPFK